MKSCTARWSGVDQFLADQLAMTYNFERSSSPTPAFTTGPPLSFIQSYLLCRANHVLFLSRLSKLVPHLPHLRFLPLFLPHVWRKQPSSVSWRCSLLIVPPSALPTQHLPTAAALGCAQTATRIDGRATKWPCVYDRRAHTAVTTMVVVLCSFSANLTMVLPVSREFFIRRTVPLTIRWVSAYCSGLKVW